MCQYLVWQQACNTITLTFSTHLIHLPFPSTPQTPSQARNPLNVNSWAVTAGSPTAVTEKSTVMCIPVISHITVECLAVRRVTHIPRLYASI